MRNAINPFNILEEEHPEIYSYTCLCAQNLKKKQLRYCKRLLLIDKIWHFEFIPTYIYFQ